MIKSTNKWQVIKNKNDLDENNKINLNDIFNKDDLKLNFELNDSIKNILFNRGIDSKDKAYKFFNANTNDLYDPFLICDMNKAVCRILKGLQDNDKIMIYGDYDTDGTTSTTILFSYLKNFTDNIDYYIPNRLSEGYGINSDAINKFKEDGVNLIITVDTGIVAIDEAKTIKELGMDLVITDHHEMQEELPCAIAVCDLKRHDESYPFRELAGCGMSFKVISAIDKYIRSYIKDGEYNTDDKLVLNVDNEVVLDNEFVNNYIDKNINIFEYLDLVCLGTIADIVPLKDENRILVKEGLAYLKDTKRPGLFALLSETIGEENLGKNKSLSARDVAFNVVPKLNAAGRIDDAKICVELFLSSDEKDAKEISHDLIKKNDKRKRTEQKIFDEATYILDNYEDFRDDKFIIVKNKDWHQGVIGIVASRICERYNKPCLILSEDENGILSGSARTMGRVNVFDILSSGKIYLSKFGGHEGACGLSLDARDFDNFKNTVMTYANKNITDELLIPVINIDNEIDANDIDINLCDEIKLLEPFGEGNEEILIKTNVSIINQSLMGKTNDHLRLKVKDPNNTSSYNVNSFDVVGFFKGNLFSEIVTGDEYEIVGSLNVNEFNGQRKVQFMLSDMRNKLTYELANNYYKTLYEKVMDKDFISLRDEDIDSLISDNKITFFDNVIDAEIYISKLINDFENYDENKEKTLIVTNNASDFITICNDYYNELGIFYGKVSDKDIHDALKTGEKRGIILCNNLIKFIDLRKNYNIIYIDSLYNAKSMTSISKSEVGALFKRLTHYEKINKNEVYLYDMLFNLKDLNAYKVLVSLKILGELEIIKYEIKTSDKNISDNELISFTINKDIKNPIENSNLYKLLSNEN